MENNTSTDCQEIYQVILAVKKNGRTETDYQQAIQDAATKHQQQHGCGNDLEPTTPVEYLTVDKVNEIIDEYLIKNGYSGREVRLHKRFTFFDDEAKSQPYEINWSACGAQSLEDAATFANAILIAKTLAETITANGEGN